MNIIFASNNLHKLNELRAAMRTFPIELIAQSEYGVEEVAETGLTFVENALIKARHASKISGLPALADDSGLVVAALNGAPGIYSARYAGEKVTAKMHNTKLLTALNAIPETNRDAYFFCVLAFMLSADDPAPLLCEGKWHGKILTSPQGEGGFGYDPIFYCPQQKKSAAELPLDIKNKISHRGIALQLFIQRLAEKI